MFIFWKFELEWTNRLRERFWILCFIIFYKISPHPPPVKKPILSMTLTFHVRKQTNYNLGHPKLWYDTKEVISRSECWEIAFLATSHKIASGLLQACTVRDLCFYRPYYTAFFLSGPRVNRKWRQRCPLYPYIYSQHVTYRIWSSSTLSGHLLQSF